MSPNSVWVATLRKWWKSIPKTGLINQKNPKKRWCSWSRKWMRHKDLSMLCGSVRIPWWLPCRLSLIYNVLSSWKETNLCWNRWFWKMWLNVPDWTFQRSPAWATVNMCRQITVFIRSNSFSVMGIPRRPVKKCLSVRYARFWKSVLMGRTRRNRWQMMNWRTSWKRKVIPLLVER